MENKQTAITPSVVDYCVEKMISKPREEQKLVQESGRKKYI